MKIKVACIQMNSTDHLEFNLHRAIQYAYYAHQDGAELIVYPEMFLFRGKPSQFSAVAKRTQEVLHKFKQMACFSRVPMVLGSIIERSKQPKKFFNSSLMISPQGKEVAHYRKRHLFDVETPKKQKCHESRDFLPGKEMVTADIAGIRFGFAICYDLRFPGHFRRLALAGAEVIVLPSNFLKETGKAHWLSLIRARAIENQVYMLAPAQVGKHPATAQMSYGHSLIVDPWGEVLAEGNGKSPEVLMASIDTSKVKALRKSFPVLKSSLD